MSENKRQFETGTVINYKSWGTAAKYLRYCGIFQRKFTADSLLSAHVNFKISQHLAKSILLSLFVCCGSCVQSVIMWVAG